MTWIIVVLFATIGTDGKLDAYVFTEPSYTTKEECMRGALEPNNIKKFVAKLVSEGLFVDNNGQLQPIDRVVCAQKDKVHEVIMDSNKLEV